MALSTQDIILKHVCPAVGDVIALIMFGSPLKAVLEVNRKKCLGELNALPFIAMAVNCTAWIIYGFLTRDFYIYFGNMPGLLFGMYFCLICYKFSKEQAQDMLRNIYLASCCLLFIIGLAQLAANMDLRTSKTLWGSTCVAILAVYYTAPLSSLAKVIAQKDSSSLHWPLCMMNIINGMLWFAYGLALKDYFVALPNGIGAGFNVICLVFCFVFPAKSRGSSRLAGQTDATANWGAIRLQSVRRQQQIPNNLGNVVGIESLGTVAGSKRGHGSGFFDLTQFRWRTGASFVSRSRNIVISGAVEGQAPAGSNVPDVASSADNVIGIDAVGEGLRQKDVENGLGLGHGDVNSGKCEDAVESSSSRSSADVVAVVPDATGRGN